jgi:two-component system sensor histidine kinase/response regulator
MDMASSSLGSLLVVADEMAHRSALCDALSSHGYSTSGASPGEAIAALRGQQFDLLLVDLTTSGTDGTALVRDALSIDPDLVAISVVESAATPATVKVMEAGALDYIVKPFTVGTALPVLARAFAIRRLRMENVRLQRELRERTLALDAANAELDALSYAVSHDLRAPLRAVNGFATILSQDYRAQLPEPAQDVLGKVIAAATRMEGLIQALLHLSRLGRLPVARDRVEIGSLVREVLKELEPEHANRRVQIRVGELPEVSADASLLRHVFANLLSNAIKFTRGRDPAAIDVASEQHDGEMVFIVQDNGVGFDMQYADKLFGAFQRLHSQQQFEGIGVGLALVKRIVRRHGGRIWAEADVDKGATFRFTLPAP